MMLTGVLISECEHERLGLPRPALLGPDREGALGLAEAHHVRGEGKVLEIENNASVFSVPFLLLNSCCLI